MNTTKVSPQMKYEKFLCSIYILFLPEQKFGLFHHFETNEAQNKKNDRILPISAMLDQPYLNTTKVNPKLENRKRAKPGTKDHNSHRKMFC